MKDQRKKVACRCVRCSTLFEGKGTKSLFCSDSCKQKNKSERRKIKHRRWRKPSILCHTPSKKPFTRTEIFKRINEHNSVEPYRCQCGWWHFTTKQEMKGKK